MQQNYFSLLNSRKSRSVKIFLYQVDGQWWLYWYTILACLYIRLVHSRSGSEVHNLLLTRLKTPKAPDVRLWDEMAPARGISWLSLCHYNSGVERQEVQMVGNIIVNLGLDRPRVYQSGIYHNVVCLYWLACHPTCHPGTTFYSIILTVINVKGHPAGF